MTRTQQSLGSRRIRRARQDLNPRPLGSQFASASKSRCISSTDRRRPLRHHAERRITEHSAIPQEFRVGIRPRQGTGALTSCRSAPTLGRGHSGIAAVVSGTWRKPMCRLQDLAPHVRHGTRPHRVRGNARRPARERAGPLRVAGGLKSYRAAEHGLRGGWTRFARSAA